MNLLNEIFSHVCGQQHCWILGGLSLPFCQRCTGLYVGALIAFILIAVFRLRPTAFMYWIHGVFMLIMFPFGFHLVEHGGLTRTFTGAAFAFGLVYYLALNPFSARGAWKGVHSRQVAVYLCSAALAVAVLLALVYWGGAMAAIVLAGLGLLGLAALMLLIGSNLIVLPRILRLLVHRSIPSPQ